MTAAPDGTPPDLRLAPGERVIDVARGITHLCPFDGPVVGTLILTNLKLIFESGHAEEPKKQALMSVRCGRTFGGAAPSRRTLTGRPLAGRRPGRRVGRMQWKGNGTLSVSLPRPGPEVFLGQIERVVKEGGMSTRREHAYALVVHCRDVRHLRFAFPTENHARRPIYERLLHAAFPLAFAAERPFFAYANKEAYAGGIDGWRMGDLDAELARQQVPLADGNSTGPHAWRITDLNRGYALCPSYPERFAVPAAANDALVTAVARFRSRARLPILGMWKRSEDDEMYLRAIAATAPGSPSGGTAQQLVIIDARPRANALANQAKGAGFELANFYPDATLEFWDIANIHVMRESLHRLASLCYPGVEEGGWYDGLHASGWLEHVRRTLRAANRVVELVEAGTPVLVHCSDGWDRTSQLTGLSMLMLDGFYRTRRGFAVMVEREWLLAGHRFALRTGHGDTHHASERAPIFVQFLDAVHQLLIQFPTAFEFNERFLIALVDELHNCRFGTFLFDNDRERQAARTATPSVWSYLLADVPATAAMRNTRYRPDLVRVLRPATALRHIRLWTAYYLRWTPQQAVSATWALPALAAASSRPKLHN